MSDQTTINDFEVNNRIVLRIAVPMTLSFMTVPLLGLVDTAVVGQFGDPAMLGGLAVGAVIFELLFTTFNFLRTGTTAFVAQAMGRGDVTEQQAIFWRAIILAAVIGIGALLLSPLVNRLALWVMDPSPDVYAAALTYITIRFLGAPFSLANYAMLGLLLGQGRSFLTLGLQTLINGLNISLSLLLGLWMGWGVAGVAWATVIGEAIVAVGALFWIRGQFETQFAPRWSEILNRADFAKLMSVNVDIMIRSFALVAAFFLFTRFGAQFDEVTLAANAVLMNFFLLSAYFLDGLAAASEQLAGRAVGARAKHSFWAVVKRTVGFGFLVSAVAATTLMVFGEHFIALMTTSNEVRSVAHTYLGWAALTALVGVLAFQMDGIFIGATWSREMRNLMLLALVCFVGFATILVPPLQNHGLWLALNLWLFVRGITMLFVLPRKARQVFT
ncbi:MAG: MATE family efflux transporter [Pseudomonadota bacterium]